MCGDELAYPIWTTPLLASLIARKAHDGQFRRDKVTPYITHPEAVVELLGGEHPDVIATAWLHDVLEDTDTTESDLIAGGMPYSVIQEVLILTKKRGETYAAYLRRVDMSSIARKVKIADIRHNLSDAPSPKQVVKYTNALDYLANVPHHQHPEDHP